MSLPAPIEFPARAEDWLAFASTRADAARERIRTLDAELKAAPVGNDAAKLALWNDAVLAGAQALNEPSLIAESHPDAAVRAAAEERVQLAEALFAERGLDRDLFDAVASIDPEAVDDLGRRVLERALRDFRRSGVDRDDQTRERLRALAERDTELSLTFSRNIREGRREMRVPAAGLAGLPQDFIDAHPVDSEGFVTLSTDYPDLMPVREYATDRETRRALVALYNDLAWPDNDAVLAELLAVRAERADLLGYGDWADYETETRMIGSSAAVAAFLTKVDEASAEAAGPEYDRLLARLHQDDPEAREVLISDFWYLLGAIKREEFAVDAQEVRSYFSYDRVLPGVLEVTGRLLDVSYVPAQIATWHADVRSYDVVRGTEVLGRIHLDMHPREGKFNHAACFPFALGITGRVLPEAVLLCNFSRGLMEHDEVVTFFHEFGHLVHDILAGHTDWAPLSGIQTEWDFVEAPSQLLEEWAWDADVLAGFTANAAGEPIPADLVQRMQVADAFGRALEVRRQLGHANTSYRLHVERPVDLATATEEIYASTSPVQPVRGTHSYAGFGHLTGYGACYYTYQWSLVIARDLLSAFGGNLMDPAVAERYRREILERGATRDASEMVESFLGRPYAFDAYRTWLAGA